MLGSDLLNEPKLIKLLKTGAVGILPTDTVYGLACLASNEAAVARLYELKTRLQNPGTIVAANTSQLESLGIKLRYLKAVEHFWPGPVSIILPCGDDLKYLHLGRYGVAVRLVADKQLHALLSNTGPLLTTSANQPTEPTAPTVVEAKHYFNDQVDFYIDGGDLSGRSPSTIIRVIDDVIEIVRPGAVIINPETGEIQK